MTSRLARYPPTPDTFEHDHDACGTHGGNDRPSVGATDSLHLAKGRDERGSDHFALRAAGGENERRDVSFGQGLAFRRTSPNVFVLAQEHPPSRADEPKDVRVGCVGKEVSSVNLHPCSRLAQRVGDSMRPEAPVDEEDDVVTLHAPRAAPT
jgi:hypothetical protein